MPVYTFRCGNCGYEYDLRQGFEAADPTTCPNCSEESTLNRVYKPVPVVFKGSGFYATDNKSASRVKNGASKSDKGDSEKSEGKEAPTKSTEKTTATKTEAKKSD